MIGGDHWVIRLPACYTSIGVLAGLGAEVLLMAISDRFTFSHPTKMEEPQTALLISFCVSCRVN